MFKTIDKTWNVFCGCEFNCVNPEARVLMENFSWKPIGEIKAGEKLIAFDEKEAWHKLRIAVVTNVMVRKAYSNLFTLQTPNAEVIVTGEHPWLHNRGYWARTQAFAYQDSTLKAINIEPDGLNDSQLYRLGYLRGICEGDATINPIYKDRTHHTYFRLALTDFDALDYMEGILKDYSISLSRLNFKNPGKPMEQLVTGAREKVWAIHKLLNAEVEDNDFYRGWLAGIFDAEGSNSGCIRIHNYSPIIRERVIQYGKKLRLPFAEEEKGCRFLGARPVFLNAVKPKISRKRDLGGYGDWGVPQKVTLKPRRTNQKGLLVVNLETTTHTYICEGLASHNCSYCNARKAALTRFKHLNRYKDGFKPHLVESELNRKFKPGEFIFLAYMGDIAWATLLEINTILTRIESQPDVKFLLQSKSPRCFSDWNLSLPHNIYLGTTLETDKPHRFSKAPHPEIRASWLASYLHPHKFLSLEPLMDFNLNYFLYLVKTIQPEIIEVGYDNYGNKLIEPRLDKTLALIEQLEKFAMVKRKTIRKAWNE